MRDLIWLPNAINRFAGMMDYIGARNPSAALKLETSIHEQLSYLRKFPYIGRPGRVKDTRELVVHPNYLIVYEVKPKEVWVLRLLHAHQQYP
jgi:toxin ParE1/3/4